MLEIRKWWNAFRSLGSGGSAASGRQGGWSLPVLLVTVVGLVCMLVDPKRVLRGELLAGLAAFLVGGLVGFLLAIPKRGTPEPKAGAAAMEGAEPYRPNTALEEISDWLVKLLVGATLVQLQHLPAAVQSLGWYMQAHRDDAIQSAILVFFACSGFFLGYLWTRLSLTGEMSRSDRDAQSTAVFYEGLMNAHLYRLAPEGYARTIALFEEYKQKYGEPNENWRMWVYLACAYGQQHAFETDASKKREAEEKALAAVKRAVAVNPSYAKALLKELMNPENEGGGQDDLAAFASVETFQNALE